MVNYRVMPVQNILPGQFVHDYARGRWQQVMSVDVGPWSRSRRRRSARVILILQDIDGTQYERECWAGNYETVSSSPPTSS